MNNQPGQMPQGQGNGQQQGQPNTQQFAQRQVPLFRPEHMRNLPANFSAEEKQKWENGLQTLYNLLENNDPNSQQALEAKKKIQDFSMTLQKKIMALSRPAPQQQPQNVAPSNQAQQQPQAQGGQVAQPQQQQSRPQPNGQAKPPLKLSDNLQRHLDSYKLVLPENIQEGTPEAEKFVSDNKHRYGMAMVMMEQGMQQLKQLEAIKTQRDQSGNPFNADEGKDWAAKKMQVQKKYSDAKAFSSSFRNTHAAANASQQNTGGASQPGQQPQTGSAQQAPPRPAPNPQQPNANSTAQQNTQTVNAAFEAARNQQQRQSVSGPPGNDHNQMPSGQQGHQTAGPNIKMEGAPQPPPVNTAVAQAAHMQQRPIQNSPQTAGPPQSATSQGPPRPLSHQAALQQSARTYSQGAGSTPQVMGHAPANMGREQAALNTVKMPIPKQLPPSATGPPTPVQMGQSRPTLTGGSNNPGNGMLSQPVVHKVPAFTVEGEGERVMNKKKLDELVRQVTGGGEGLESGEGLTPEVEDCVLNVADEFVDQVITAACRCAKARGSKTLEIRDIQLVLERNYNIRIPGYASDEIRTVRKFQPAQGWIAKMSAIQAAKVTGGKGDL